MSISSAQRTRLGIFIVVSIALTVMIIITGVGLKLSKKTATYYSEFTGESLSGLSKGMEVKFRGIPIGKVEKISYNPKDLSSVTVTFQIDTSFPMKRDMIAQTGMLGITGLKYIEIMGGTNEAAVVPEGSMIPSKSSLMAELSTKMEGILEKVETLLENLTVATNPDSLKNLYTTLDNVATLTSNLNGVVETAEPRLDSITLTLNRTLSNVDSMVQDFSDNGELNSIMKNVDSTMVSLRDLSANFNLTFVQSREDLGATMADIRETMENLNDLSSMLLENPSLILRGSPQQKRKIK